ncbi:MAG TPA: VWA domain-containing protein [Pyrinomonadaceae bacterium]|jgi:VWFA-related protein|nr:VWA domain-containing protein [Pyrinomonadaceae bacterium]
MRTAPLIRRVIILWAIISVPAATAFAQQKPDEVVRVNTELVQTDFMVFDKQGNFVDGLKRDQFAFKVEGKPREVLFFDRVAAGSRSEEAQLAAARGTNASGAVPVPMDRGRTVLFFIDDLHLSVGSATYTRRMLKHFIDSEMKQNDRAQIASTSGTLGFLQQITDNKSVLTAAADRLRSFEMTLQTAEYPPMTEYQATVIEQHDTDLLDFFIDKLIENEGPMPREQAAQIIKNRASQLIEDGASQVTRSFSTLRGFVKLAAALPGRKIVFFVSDGFLIDKRRTENMTRLQQITNAAARSGVVIYSLDARGLGAGLPNASRPQMADVTGVLTRANMGEVPATQDGMNALASDTGGRAFFNTNSMSTAIATALKESSTYYLLAWRPENEEQSNPKFRRIEVSVVGRPDLVVRFRRGFGEPPEEMARTKAKESETPTVRKSPSDEINSVLTAQYPTRAMPVAIALNFLDTAQYGGTLTTTIKVGTSQLTLDKQPEGMVGAVDVAGLVLNDQGKSVSSFNKRFTIKGAATNTNNKPPDNIFYNHFSILRPGLYQVRVAAIDVKTGTRGSAYEWIEVPNVANKELAMSSLIVGEKKPEEPRPPADASSAVPNDPQPPEAIKRVVVNVDHTFASSSTLRFLTFIYNASVGTANPMPNPQGETIPASTKNNAYPDIAVQTQIFRDDEPVITNPLHKIQTEGIPDMQRVPYAADVLLDGLKPGAYVLQVTVIDKLAKSSATRKLSFQIE